MAFAIIRTAKLKTAGNLGGLNNHLERKMEVPNADRDLSYLNQRRVGSGDLARDVAGRIQAAGIEKPRKNAVLAIEHLMTASPEAFPLRKDKSPDGSRNPYRLVGSKADVDRWQAFEKNCINWLQERYGKDNLVNFTSHLDEQTPHIHAVVVPIDSKGKLNCRDYLGGRDKLRDLQDSFAAIHQGIGLERGIQGSKAHHTTVKQFYGQAKEFEQAPSLEIQASAPVASIQAPETNLFGQMKLDPQAYAQGQEKRLKAELAAHHQQTLLKAQQKAQELHKAAQAAQVLKLENQRLKGQIKGLQKQVSSLTDQLHCSHDMVKQMADKKFTPETINKGLTQVAKTEAEKALQVCLTMMGMKVKEPEPELKPQIRRSKGLGR
jgi:hypothetical protein